MKPSKAIIKIARRLVNRIYFVKKDETPKIADAYGLCGIIGFVFNRKHSLNPVFAA